MNRNDQQQKAKELLETLLEYAKNAEPHEYPYIGFAEVLLKKTLYKFDNDPNYIMNDTEYFVYV